MPYDVTSLRSAFPLLKRIVQSRPLVYLDSAATSQKPNSVLDAMDQFLRNDNANINRGVHPLAEAATRGYEEGRQAISAFLGAQAHEVIITKNATESINLVARSYGEMLQPEDCVVLSIMEHHSNIIPWLQLRERRGIELLWVDVDAEGMPMMATVQQILTTKKVKLVSMTGLSNVLGSLPDITAITKLAHEYGAHVLIDATQLAAHTAIDVQEIDCDFLVFSGHKVYGPTGIGVLYGKAKLLQEMPTFLGGGDMIASVTTEGFTPAELPRKFEAGTPPMTEMVGLAAAIAWIHSIGIEDIEHHEYGLLTHAYDALQAAKGITILGPKNPEQRHGCISFTVEGMHPHDLTQLLGDEGICLRAGHHCAQPLHRSLGINASARLSVAAYNTIEEIDRCIDGLERARFKLTAHR